VGKRFPPERPPPTDRTEGERGPPPAQGQFEAPQSQDLTGRHPGVVSAASERRLAVRREGIMQRREVLKSAALAAAGTLLGGRAAYTQSAAPWSTIFDGRNLDAFTPLGDANWRLEDGSVVADKGAGFLLTKASYGDFELRVEFWADEDANSGIFIRCSDTKTITAANSYEVNIFDKRPEAIYGTGAIVDVAKVDPMPKAGGKWNLFEIAAKGPSLTVVLNGQKTVDNAPGAKFLSGPFALQYAPGVVKDKGVIKFRKVEIRAI
jgi:Domain of Unknown Function (DUF1080)